jgi:heat shock protein HtpX
MKFLRQSLLILLLLYGIVFAIGDAYLAHEGVPRWVAIIFVVVVAGGQYLFAPWLIEWFYDISWDDLNNQLPARNQEFVEQLCAQRGLKVPRMGIIESGTPNAFSFGRVRSDSRVVVTRGLLDILTVEESNAVLAHEIGHIEHYDFIVMTIASMVPLLLYQLYVWTANINNVRVIAYTAYLCYLLSQYVVLLLNRTREYFADHYAAEVTHAPNDLSSALVKIAYGLVKAQGDYQQSLKSASKKEKAVLRRNYGRAGSLAVMGISNLRSGEALVLGSSSPQATAAVMRWDLVNPWARVYELSSTHPLTAFRIRELNAEAMSMSQAPEYPIPQDTPKHWGLFPIELFLWAAPWISGFLLIADWWAGGMFARPGVVIPAEVKPILLLVMGITLLLRTLYRYRGEFQPANVSTLLEDVEVSQMRPRAVRLEGEIVGRGVPGAFWSPDLVFRDSSGIIFLLYRQSIPFMRLWFALENAEAYMGGKVTVDGWFRRGLKPYVEMAKITDDLDLTHRAYSRWVYYAASVIAIVAGALWLKG